MMKNTIKLLSLVLFSIAAGAQTVDFRIDYKPNTTYTSTTAQKDKMQMSYGEEPMQEESQSKMAGTFTTGGMDNGKIPYAMVLTVEEGDAIQFSGTKISGTIQSGQPPVIETVTTPGNDAMVNDMLKVMIKEMFKQSWFEPRQVKMGETFVIEIPMDIPLGTVNMKLNDIGTYKLERVEGSMAYFRQNHVITMDMDIEGQNMKGSGTGIGTMVFDMDNNFIIQNDLDMGMDLGFEVQGTLIQIQSETKISVKVKIAPAN